MFNISEEVNSVSSVNTETEEVATESFLYDEYDVYEDFAMEAAVSKKEQKLSNHVADLLKRVTRKVNRFRSVEKLEAYAEKLNAEIEKYNDVLSIMKKLCEKFEDEKIDKVTFSAKMKEAQKTLKNQLDILSISDFNGNSKSVGSEEIVALNEFLTGARKIVDARREYLNASEKAESSDAKEGLETPVVEDEVAEEGCTKKKCTESCGECEYTDEDIDMSYNAYEAACKKYCASEGCDKKPLTKKEFKIAITNKEIQNNKDLKDKILKGQFTKDDLDAMGILKEYDDDDDDEDDDDDDKKCSGSGKCKEKEAEEACKNKCAKEACGTKPADEACGKKATAKEGCGSKNAEEACVRKNGVKVMSSSDCKKKGGCESFTEFLESMTIGMEEVSVTDTENEVAEEACAKSTTAKEGCGSKTKSAEEGCAAKSKCAKEACSTKPADEACGKKTAAKESCGTKAKAEEAVVSFNEIKRLVVQRYEDAKKLRTTSPADAEKSLVSASETLKSVDEKNARWKDAMQKKIDTLRVSVAQALKKLNNTGVTPEDIKIDVNAEKRRFYKVYATAKKQVTTDPASATVQLQDASEIIKRLKAAGENTESLEKLLNRLMMKKMRTATESATETEDLDAADIDTEDEVAEEGLGETIKAAANKAKYAVASRLCMVMLTGGDKKVASYADTKKYTTEAIKNVEYAKSEVSKMKSKIKKDDTNTLQFVSESEKGLDMAISLLKAGLRELSKIDPTKLNEVKYFHPTSEHVLFNNKNGIATQKRAIELNLKQIKDRIETSTSATESFTELDEDELAEESILNEAFLAGESDLDAADIDAEDEVAEEGLGAKIRTAWVVKHGALKKEAALKKKEAAKMVREKKFDKASEYLEEAIKTLDELDAQIAELDMSQYETFTPGSGEKKESYKNYKDDLHNWVVKEKEKITDQISKVQEKQSKSAASESFVKDAFESYLNELGLDADGNEIESVDDDAEMNSALEALNDAELDNIDADIDLELAFDDEDEE